MKNKLSFLLFFISVFLFVTQIKSQSLLGIDVSHHQGSIDWDQVANDGKVYAWAKATESTGYTDSEFQNNMSNGIAAGVVMGAYHFAHPDANSATDEANHFLSVAGNYIGDGFLPPVLDLEDRSGVHLDQEMTSTQLTNWVVEWCQAVESQTGVKPVIYTNSNYANYLHSSVTEYGLWIADPDGDPSDPPSNIGVWNTWLFKQYSWNGTVSGINSSAVDLDVFNGSTTDFNNLIHGNNSNQNNDYCEDAILLQSSPVCQYVNGDVTNATPDSGFAPGSCDAYSGTPLGAGVFYKFYATNTEHTITVEPLGDLDAVVVLYQGDDCSDLTEVQCEDTPGGGGTTTIMHATGLIPGQLYWIRVYDYGSVNASDGRFQICVTNPYNDDCADAMMLQSSPECHPTFASVTNATPDSGFAPGSCDAYSGTPLGAGVFFKFIAASSNETITVNPTGDLDAVVVLYEGNDCSNLTEVQCLDAPGGSGGLTQMEATGLTPGQLYWVRVYDYGSQNASNGDFNICITHPTYDDCAGAILLQSDVDCHPVFGSVTDATPDNGFAPGSCDAYSGTPLGAGVFYKFVATHTEHTITVSPLGDLDAVVVLYQGNDCSNLTEVQCEDTPGGPGVTTILDANGLTPGETYWVRIYDYGSQNASNGDFNICVTNPDDNSSDDIYISNAAITSGQNVDPGDNITVDVTENYSGNSTSLPPVTLKYYLSEDCILDANDVLLGEETTTLDANNNQVSFIDTLTIPASTPSGTYSILVIADATNAVSEVYEDNNTSCLTLFVTGDDTTDLYPTNPHLSQSSASPGDEVGTSVNEVFQSTSNKGGAKKQVVYMYYYLSSDTVWDANDYFVGETYTNFYNADTTVLIQNNIVIPNSVSLGNYYVLFISDPTNLIYEYNENNNITYAPITIIQPSTVEESRTHSDITIYPNPAHHTLNVNGNSNIERIDVINMQGKVVKQFRKINTIHYVIDVNDLQNGVYYLVITENKKQIIKKFIKAE